MLPIESGGDTIGMGHPFFPQRFGDEALASVQVFSAHKETSGMPNAITDRRAAPRYTLILLAEVTDVVSSTKFTARTSDLSRTGCYLDMLNPLPRGTKIQIRLQREKETLELPGTVIYVSPGLGIGVAFAENLSENQTAVLDRWLAAAAKANP